MIRILLADDYLPFRQVPKDFLETANLRLKVGSPGIQQQGCTAAPGERSGGCGPDRYPDADHGRP